MVNEILFRVDPTVSKAMIHNLGLEKIEKYVQNASKEYEERPSTLSPADYQPKYSPTFAAWIPEETVAQDFASRDKGKGKGGRPPRHEGITGLMPGREVEITLFNNTCTRTHKITGVITSQELQKRKQRLEKGGGPCGLLPYNE